MTSRILALLGLFLTVSHIFTINIGISVKVPEIMMLLLIVLWLTEPRIVALKAFKYFYIALFLALIIGPTISNLFSISISDKLRLGAAWLHNTSLFGRQNPLASPWILLVWNFFSFATVVVFSSYNSTRLERFWKLTAVSIFVLNIYSFYHLFVQYLYWPDIPWPGDARRFYEGHFRTSGFFIEPLNLGHFLVYGIPLLFCELPKFESSMSHFIFIKLNRFLAGLAFLATASVSAAISLFAGITYTIIFYKKFNKRDFWRLAGGGSLFLAVTMAIPYTRNVFVLKVIRSFTDPNLVGHSIIDRIEKMKSGWAIFNDYPIFGTGLNTSGFLYPLYRSKNAFLYFEDLPFPLNEYFRLLAEVGLFGTGCFLISAALYLKILSKYQHLMTQPELMLFGGGFVGSLVAFCFSGLFNVYFIWLFAGLSLGIIVQRENSSRKTALIN